jgi:hypothetical protein
VFVITLVTGGSSYTNKTSNFLNEIRVQGHVGEKIELLQKLVVLVMGRVA